MEIVLTLFFILILGVFFIFLVIIPIIGLYVGLSNEALDEKKYGLEGARYIDGK
jgi:hypothetical protein